MDENDRKINKINGDPSEQLIKSMISIKSQLTPQPIIVGHINSMKGPTNQWTSQFNDQLTPATTSQLTPDSIVLATNSSNFIC